MNLSINWPLAIVLIALFFTLVILGLPLIIAYVVSTADPSNLPWILDMLRVLAEAIPELTVNFDTDLIGEESTDDR